MEVISVADSVKVRRLHDSVATVCPIISVHVPEIGNSSTVTISFDAAATLPQQTAAQNVVDTFDWSDAADVPFVNQSISEVAQKESDAAVKSVDDGVSKNGIRFERLCMATVLVALDALNADRTALTAMNNAVQAATSLADLKTRFASINFPPQVTQNQLQTAVKNKLSTFPT
jgi:hypothetical protein